MFPSRVIMFSFVAFMLETSKGKRTSQGSIVQLYRSSKRLNHVSDCCMWLMLAQGNHWQSEVELVKRLHLFGLPNFVYRDWRFRFCVSLIECYGGLGNFFVLAQFFVYKVLLVHKAQALARCLVELPEPLCFQNVPLPRAEISQGSSYSQVSSRVTKTFRFERACSLQWLFNKLEPCPATFHPPI